MPPAAGGFAPRPPKQPPIVNFWQRAWLCASAQATVSNLPFYIFVPQKAPLSKISDDVIAGHLWFGSPTQPKILITPMRVACFFVFLGHFPTND